MPSGLDSDGIHQTEALVGRRIRLRKGETLFRAGEKFMSLYAIRTGSCKTVLPGEDGQDQVAGYHMAGDVIGTDGIGAGSHDCEAIALEDMEVCGLPFNRVEELARQSHQFQRRLNRLLSQEITRERRITMILGQMHADQRLATFLLDLALRYQERGYSSVEFVLRMTREEIGSYLGLKLETVSRLFSRFHEEGLIQVHGRVVKLLDRVALKMVVGASS
jgi:CRP/FNR family transcriptional regulator